MLPYHHMENSEKKFANGFFFNKHASSPDFVIGSLGIKVDEAIEWMKQQKQKENGFINVDIKKGQTGKYYLELNEYEQQGG